VIRFLRGVLVLAAIASTSACKTAADPFPAQAAFSFDITDSRIGTVYTAPPAAQVVVWTVDDASATDLTGYDGTYTFLGTKPCVYSLNVATPYSFSAGCHASGLTLAPGVDRTATIHVGISRLEIRQAQRPDLSSTADPDGDGIPNATDNCPIVYNPDQANYDAGSEVSIVGDACSLPDANRNLTVPDQDADGFADAFDNCLWYPNPKPDGVVTPPDTDQDGIGDACERVARVVLPPGGLKLACSVTFKSTASTASLFRMDFGAAGVLDCDGSLTNCTLHPDAIVLSLSGSTTTFPCQPDP
jgi:Thrombospondin type 3 repeat